MKDADLWAGQLFCYGLHQVYLFIVKTMGGLQRDLFEAHLDSRRCLGYQRKV